MTQRVGDKEVLVPKHVTLCEAPGFARIILRSVGQLFGPDWPCFWGVPLYGTGIDAVVLPGAIKCVFVT